MSLTHRIRDVILPLPFGIGDSCHFFGLCASEGDPAVLDDGGDGFHIHSFIASLSVGILH